jgi:hypothetical protein
VLNENYYQGIASDLSNQGRYGDSMLMHVNPAEVQGLAAAFPGNVTRNPETGLPEAFGIMASLALGALIGGVTNVATKSETPLWKSILMGAAGSALTGGLMSGLGAVGSAGTEAAKQAALEAAKTGAGNIAAGGLTQGAGNIAAGGLTQGIGNIGAGGLTQGIGNVGAQSLTDVATQALTPTGGLGLPSSGEILAQQAAESVGQQVADPTNLLTGNPFSNIPTADQLVSEVAPTTNIFGEPGTNTQLFSNYLGSPSSVGAFALPQMYEEEEEIESQPATEYPVYWNS